jgi:hypothetical protein
MSTDESMKPRTSQTGTPISGTHQEDSSGIWPVILRGLTLLTVVAVIGIILWGPIALIRLLIDPAKYFLVQQVLFAIVMITELALAIITYIFALRWTLRHIEAWRESGQTSKVIAGLVALTFVALILALPVILALFFHIGV